MIKSCDEGARCEWSASEKRDPARVWCDRMNWGV